LYIKKQFNDNPLFTDTKVVFSLHNDEFTGSLDKELSSKLISEHITAKDVKQINDPTYLNLMKLAIDNSDGIVVSSDQVNPELLKYAKKSGKQILPYKSEEEYVQACSDFYDTVLDKVEELVAD
jgi:starch synthase